MTAAIRPGDSDRPTRRLGYAGTGCWCTLSPATSRACRLRHAAQAYAAPCIESRAAGLDIAGAEVGGRWRRSCRRCRDRLVLRTRAARPLNMTDANPSNGRPPSADRSERSLLCLSYSFHKLCNSTQWSRDENEQTHDSSTSVMSFAILPLCSCGTQKALTRCLGRSTRCG